MCGICGFAGLGEAPILAAMNARLAHRGPDGQGVYHHAGQRVFFGHRRLAIVDLAGGAQPMSTADAGLTVTFNGEIYNHLELRAELTAKGHRFQTDHCDTEVLLHGYREWGADLPRRLNGMWALAIHDACRAEIFLSRDRFGKKPLYYAHQGDSLAFASELTALMAHPLAQARIDRAALMKYFALGFIPAPNSLYQGVKKLPAGHNLLVRLNDGQARLSRYFAFCLEPEEPTGPRPEEAYGERLRELLSRAVKRRLMSDVPLGVFLSGGVDSSSITALAARHVSGIKTFSIGFREKSFDESGPALFAARLFGTEHHQETLSLDKALSLLPQITARLDEPMGDSSLLPTYLLSRETRQQVTVALGGDGADELFAGYDPFRALSAAKAYAKLCPRPVHQALLLLAAKLPVSQANMALGFKISRFLGGLSHESRLWNPVWLGPASPAELAGLFGEPCDPEEVYAEVVNVWEECPSTDMVDKTLEFYTRLYLQDDILTKVDRASMMNSLEVRAPYLDIELVDFARRIPHRFKLAHGQGKYILKKALEPILPARILNRAKKGFGAPIGQWFRDKRLTLPSLDAYPLDQGFAAAKLAEHQAGRADNRLLLWNLWVLGHYQGRA